MFLAVMYYYRPSKFKFWIYNVQTQKTCQIATDDESFFSRFS